MATVSSLVTVFLDPDSNEPLALSALGEGDVISERIGGTGRTDISGLVSSVGNVNISYNSTTRQFVVDEVSGVSAEVTFESVRDALASGSGELAFSGDFVISGGGKFRGDLSGNLSGTALSATNAIAVPGVTINGIALAANAGAFTTGDPTNESSVRAALASATAAVTLNNKNLSGVGEIRASVVSATTLSGNLSGVATRAEAVTGVVINSTSYNLSSGTNINISTTATVDFPSVSSAIFSATGPLFFNNQDVSGIGAVRANNVSSTNVSASNRLAAPSISGTNASITSNITVTGNVSSLGSFSGPNATITSFTGTDIRATNSVSAESFSATSGRISTLSALTSFSAPTITAGGLTTTGTANFQGGSNNFNGLTVTSNQGLFQAGVTVTGTMSATDVRGIASVSAASVSAANTIDAPIVRTSNYFSGNLSGNAVSANYASAIENVIINGTSVNLRSGQSTTIAATGTVSFSGVKDALEAATSGVGFNSQEISGISTGRFGDLRASASVSANSVSGLTGRFNTSVSSPSIFGDSVVTDLLRNPNGANLTVSTGGAALGDILIDARSTQTVKVGSISGTVELGRTGITTTTKGLLRVNEAATFDSSLSANSVSGLTGRFNTSVSTPSLEVNSVVNNTGGLVLSSLDVYNTSIYGENIILTTDTTGIIQIPSGRLEAPIVRTSNYFSGNLSGLATSADNARIIPGCLINGSAVSANASITIAAGSVDFTSVSGAIFTGTGPLTFNGKDLNGVEDISASGDLRASSVSATNVSGLTGRFNTSLSTPSFTGTNSTLGTASVTGNLTVTGTLGVTGVSTFNDDVNVTAAGKRIKATSVSATNLSGTYITADFGLTANGPAQVNSTITTNDLVATTTIRAPSVSATTQFSAPNAVLTAATIGTASITTANITNNVNVTGDITAARVNATAAFSGASATINGSATITGGLTTTSLQLNGSGRVTGSLTVNGNSTLGTTSGDSISLNSPLTITNAAGTAPITIYGASKAIAFNGNAVSLNMNGNNAAISLAGIAPNITMGSGASLNVNNDGSGYISYVSAGYLKVGDMIFAGTIAGGAVAQGNLTFENEANFTSDINVSGDLYVTSLTPTATGNYVLTVSSGGSGLVSTKKLVTGAVLPAGGVEPAFFDGSLIRYEQTGGYYQPAQYVRVTASDAGLELSQGVGISIADAGYVAIGGGGTLSVTGVSTLSSLLVPSSVSATTYLNVRPYVSSVDSATTTSVNISGDYNLYLVNTTTTSVTLYLPAASAWTSKQITVSKVDDGGSYRSVTLSSTELQTATNTVVLYDPTESVTVVSNGTNWYSLDYDRSYGVVVVGKNNTASTLTKGTPVKITGALGSNITVGPVSAANNHIPSDGIFHCIGLVEHDIPAGEFGHILRTGTLFKYNTNSYTLGDYLYIASGGGLTNVKPTPPYEAILVGIVTRVSTTNGSIVVALKNSEHINDIVGMNLASSLVSGDLISYDLATSTFKNVQSIDISGTIKGGTVSATSYANLPYTSAIWYAGNMFSKNLESAAPASNGDLILYDENNDYWGIYPSSTIAGAGGAPTNAQYLTLAADGTLSNERVFSVGAGLGSSDAGANGNYTLSANHTSAIWNANKLQGNDVKSTAPADGDVLTWNTASSIWNLVTSSTFGAPLGASYITLGSNARLTAERILTIGDGLGSSDGGANSTYTLSANYASAIWNASQIQGTNVSSTAPTTSQRLVYDGIGWKPGWLESSTITGSGTITLNGNDDIFFASANTSGTQVLSLPAASSYTGKSFTVIKVDSSGLPIIISGTSLSTTLNRVKLRLPRERCDFYSDGTNWYPNTIRRDFGGCPSNAVDLFEDFVFGSTETGEVGINGWSFTNGSFGNLAPTSYVSSTIGIIRRTGGTTAAQVASMYPGNAGTALVCITDNIKEYKIRMQASGTAANHAVNVGFLSDLTSSAPTNGIYFQRIPTDTNWFAVTRRASAQTRYDTGIAYDATGLKTFRIFIRDLNNVQFFIDDVLVANDTNAGSTIPLTNIGVVPGHNITGNSTAAAATDIDYISILLETTGERY